VGAPEYARPNTGARTTLGSSANGALPITGTRITRGNNANSALPIGSSQDGENKKQRRKPCECRSSRRGQRPRLQRFFAEDRLRLASARQARLRLQFSITPHQFQKANRIAQWTNLAHLIGVNSCDRDRLNPVAFAAGDDEHFGVVVETVPSPKQLRN
jgi:hypothetical protein